MGCDVGPDGTYRGDADPFGEPLYNSDRVLGHKGNTLVNTLSIDPQILLSAQLLKNRQSILQILGSIFLLISASFNIIFPKFLSASSYVRLDANFSMGDTVHSLFRFHYRPQLLVRFRQELRTN